MFEIGEYIRLKYMTIVLESYMPDTNCFVLNSDEIDSEIQSSGGYPQSWDNVIYISAMHSMWGLQREIFYELPECTLNGGMTCPQTGLRYDIRKPLANHMRNHYVYINKVDFTKNVEMNDLMYVVNVDNKTFAQTGHYYLIPSQNDYENQHSPYAHDQLFSLIDITKGLLSKSMYLKERSSNRRYDSNLGNNFVGVTYPGETFWGKIIDVKDIFSNIQQLTVEMFDGIVWHIHSTHVEIFNPDTNGIEAFHASNNEAIRKMHDERIAKNLEELPFRPGGWEFD